MNEVFILGAGFSKAISPQMPVTAELSKEIAEYYRHQENISTSIRRRLEENFEQGLTYLSEWHSELTDTENQRNRGLYRDLARVIQGVFLLKNQDPAVWGTNRPPLWLEALITYWHNNRSTVLTLNYDTMIERVAGSVEWHNRANSIPTGHLYPVPLREAAAHAKTGGGKGSFATFSLFKLHGSINWLYSGKLEFSREELCFVPCEGGVDSLFTRLDGVANSESSAWEALRNMQPLIVPPVLDKNAFLKHPKLQAMRQKAADALQAATKVVCIGYSLPSTDLAVAQLLKDHHPSIRIPFEIVDMAPRKTTHFARVLGKAAYRFTQTFSGFDCVPRFVIHECIPDHKDQVYVLRMTHWRNLKTILRDECLPELRVRCEYFSRAAICGCLKRRKISYTPATLNRYLFELTDSGIVFDAGRGWYSSLAKPFKLDIKPVAELAESIQQQFRFLKFSCWSTDQVRPFMQHLLTRSVYFVSAEAHALESVRDFLENHGFNAYVDPKRSEVRRHVQFKGKTVILRPSHSKEPSSQLYAGIEKILVDFRIEADALKLMDVSEFHLLANEVMRQGRVQIAALIRYSKSMQLPVVKMFGQVKSIIAKY